MTEVQFIWERPEPKRPRQLSREKIVHAAIACADADGLEAVTLRKVAAMLEVGPMRLYGYVSSKAELLELMVDAVYEEMASEKAVTGDWRKALWETAHRIRRAAGRHRWFVDLLGGRPHLGPNALAHLEASFAALGEAPGLQDIDTAMQAIATVNAYVVGAIQMESSRLSAEEETGLDLGEWRAAVAPYLQRMIATGKFPNLAKVVAKAGNPSFDYLFNKGLNCVLDGIAAGISAR